jgi:hypothetical protein
VLLIGAIIFFLKMLIAGASAQSRETTVYGPDGKYQGSVFDYGRTQTYTDRNGQFTGSAVNNGNGTASFFYRNGNFSGSAGSSIDRALTSTGGNYHEKTTHYRCGDRSALRPCERSRRDRQRAEGV